MKARYSRKYPTIGLGEAKKHGLLYHLAGILFSTIVLFLLIEGILRLFGVESHIPLVNPEGPFMVDPILKWRLRENYDGRWSKVSFRTNAAGLRDDPITLPRPEGEVRIMVLGASITAGYNLERPQPYPDKLEELLKRTQFQGFNVINAGIPGFSVQQNYLYLKHYGIKLEPTMILYCFSIRDVIEHYLNLKNSKRDAFRGGGAYFRLNPETNERSLLAVSDFDEFRDLLLEKARDWPHYTAFYTAANWLKMKVFAKYLAKREADQYEAYAAEILNPATVEKNPLYKKAWAESLTSLEKLLEVAQENKIPIMVHMFPLREQLTTASSNDYPQALIAKFCLDHHIGFLDLLPAFREKANENNNLDELFLDFEHPSVNGHNVAANALYREVVTFEVELNPKTPPPPEN